MHSSYIPFALLTSILLLTTAVRPHPHVPLPSSGEPPAAFPLENSGFLLQDTEDVGFGSIEGNLISQSNACNQRSNSFKSRRLRNRNPSQKLPSSCLVNPIETNSQSEPQIEPDKEQSGVGNRELNEGENNPMDVPIFDFRTEGKDSTTPTANSELCPPERIFPACADDNAIIAMPEGVGDLFTQVTYMLYPAYACTSPRWL